MSRPPVRFTFSLPSFMLTRQTSATKSLIQEAPITPVNQPFNQTLYSPNYRININQSNNQAISQSTLSQRTPRQRSANTSPTLNGRVSSANQLINQLTNQPMGGRLNSANQSINQTMSVLPPMIRTSSASVMSPSNRTPHAHPSTPSTVLSPNQTTQPTNQSCLSRVYHRLSTSHSNTAAMIGIYSRPWLQSRYTLLVLSFMLIVFNLISLYFASFAFYLTHSLHTTAAFVNPTPSDPTHQTEVPNQCATKELTAFLLFIMIRSTIEICLLGWRAIDRTLWINNWSSLKPYQKLFVAIRSLLSLFTLMFLGLAIRWLSLVSADASGSFRLGQLDCVQLAYEVVVGLTAYEIAGLITPVVFLIPLSCFFSWRTLSYFSPFFPLPPDMFEKPIAGLSADEIKQLPQTTYDPQQHSSEKCSICLGEFTQNQNVRVLGCNHVFDVECIDEWLSTKRTCPLCVQVVEPVSNKRRFSFAISRTRRNESVTRSQQSNNEHSDDEDEHHIGATDEHDFGIRHHSPVNQLTNQPIAIEMIDQSSVHSQ